MIKHDKYPYEDQRDTGHQVRTPRRQPIPQAIREAGQGQIKDGIPFHDGVPIQGGRLEQQIQEEYKL